MCKFLEEYWFDGENDCTDWTDEADITYRSGDNCLETPSFICDEHFYPYNQWSCADVIQTACSRARTTGSGRGSFAGLFGKQFKSQKEHYITPIIIVFSSLPQAILSFSYACTELKQSWQRYTLLTTYFLSYLPQMLGFILYVLPSTSFSQEFRQTTIGKRIIRRQQQDTQTMKKNVSIIPRLQTEKNLVASKITKPKSLT